MRGIANEEMRLRMLNREILSNPTEFNETYGEGPDGQAGAQCTLKTETWLSAPSDLDPRHAASADYIVDDAMGPDGWNQTIRGSVVELTTSGELFLARQLPELSPGAQVLVLRGAEVLSVEGVALTDYTFVPVDRMSDLSIVSE